MNMEDRNTYFDRDSVSGEILPLPFEKLNISDLVRAISLIVKDYENYTEKDSILIIDGIESEEQKENKSKLYLERLIARSVQFKARNGEIGFLEIELDNFELDCKLPKANFSLEDVTFRSNSSTMKSKIKININLDSSNISLYIESFLKNGFAEFGVGSDIMKILIAISQLSKLDIMLVSSFDSQSFYIDKHDFFNFSDYHLRRNFWS